MAKRKITPAPKNKPLDIADHPTHPKYDAKVSPEIIIDEQSLVSTKEQRPYMPGGITGKGFQPGESGNPSGRPPDIIKGIALRLGQLKIGKILSPEELEKLKKLGLDTAGITVIESIVLDWATSKNPFKQQLYVERVAGKVPDINYVVQMNENIVRRFRSKFTDAELERIISGEDPLDILLEKLPDADDAIDVR